MSDIAGRPPTSSEAKRFAHSKHDQPIGMACWEMLVADQLVDAAGDDWSEPVQFRFERLPNGRLDMLVRRMGSDERG